jgi:hypothetical protein
LAKYYILQFGGGDSKEIVRGWDRHRRRVQASMLERKVQTESDRETQDALHDESCKVPISEQCYIRFMILKKKVSG